MSDTLQNQHDASDEVGSSGDHRALQLLHAGSFQFGIFAEEILSTAAWRAPTPLPHAPKSVLGVVSIQGRMLTVLDLAAFPGHEAASTSATAQHLVALRGDEQLALAADGLGETVQFPEADLDTRREAGETFALGVWHRGDTDIYILDPKELFATAIQGCERRRRRF